MLSGCPSKLVTSLKKQGEPCRHRKGNADEYSSELTQSINARSFDYTRVQTNLKLMSLVHICMPSEFPESQLDVRWMGVSSTNPGCQPIVPWIGKRGTLRMRTLQFFRARVCIHTHTYDVWMMMHVHTYFTCVKNRKIKVSFSHTTIPYYCITGIPL